MRTLKKRATKTNWPPSFYYISIPSELLGLRLRLAVSAAERTILRAVEEGIDILGGRDAVAVSAGVLVYDILLSKARCRRCGALG